MLFAPPPGPHPKILQTQKQNKPNKKQPPWSIKASQKKEKKTKGMMVEA